jgi:hypothetical protein
MISMPADDLDPSLAPGSSDPDATPELGPVARSPFRLGADAPAVTDLDNAWQAPAPVPTRERDDELLADPPKLEHGGRLAGYAAGTVMRRVLFALVVVLVAGGVALVVWFTRTREPTHAQQFQLPEGSEMSSRPRTMVWSGGAARLGLDRAPPGLLAVELPDRTLRLADGSDQAQFKVEVEDGKTKRLKVLFGEVVEELQPGAEPRLKPKGE